MMILPIREMSTCRYIAYYDGTEFYRDRTPVQRGYYVVTEDEKGNRTINPLRDWLNNH